MTTTLFRGLYDVRTKIADYLATAFPAWAAKAEAQWAANSYNITLPVKYDAFEPMGVSDSNTPLIGITVSRVTDFTVVDLDDTMAEEYRPTYTVRVFIWCYTQMEQVGSGPDVAEVVPEDAYADTIRQRDDLAAILRACILDRLSLGSPDIFNVDAKSIVEEPSDLVRTPTSSGRWLASDVITFNVKVDEALLRAQIGQVPSTGVDVISELLPKVGE